MPYALRSLLLAVVAAVLLVAIGRSVSAAPTPAQPSSHARPHAASASATASEVVTASSQETPPAAPPAADCDVVARKYAPIAPDGWTITCVEALPSAWVTAVGERDGVAMSRLSQRSIVLVRGHPGLASAAVHEIGHAVASTWPPAVRVAFARALGQAAWQTRHEFTSPSEIFSESTVACQGLPTDPRYPLVPCELIDAAVHAAAGRAVQ